MHAYHNSQPANYSGETTRTNTSSGSLKIALPFCSLVKDINMTTRQPWDPWKMYDIPQSEMRAIRERAKMREALKAEWQKKLTDPYRGSHDGGHIVSSPFLSLYLAVSLSFYYCASTSSTSSASSLVSSCI